MCAQGPARRFLFMQQLDTLMQELQTWDSRSSIRNRSSKMYPSRDTRYGLYSDCCDEGTNRAKNNKQQGTETTAMQTKNTHKPKKKTDENFPILESSSGLADFSLPTT